MPRNPYANDLTPYERMKQEREMTEEIARQREEAKRMAWAQSEPHHWISEQWLRKVMEYK